MKKIIALTMLAAFCFTSSGLAFSKSDINIQLKNSTDLYQKMLAPIWNEIPNDYQWSDKKTTRIWGDNITATLENAHLNLGPVGSELATITHFGDQKLFLKWNLHTLTSNLVIKLHFKFKKFGVEIKHDEYFDVRAEDIRYAATQVGLVTANKKLDLSVIKNEGFKFASVKVTPRDGIGNTLSWIFNNIFSEAKVSSYITNKVNTELQNWINKDELIVALEDSINHQLMSVEDIDIRINEIASHLRVNFKTFSLSEEYLNLAVGTTFDNSALKVHTCAQNMLRAYGDHVIGNKDYTDSSAGISFDIVSKMLNNFATYESFQNGLLQEPLFCFGFKDYDDEGNALGNSERVKIGGRNIDFTYWISPSSAPKYEYLPEEDMVIASMNLEIKITGQGYPRIRAENDTLHANLIGKFKIEYVEGKGLNLVFKELLIPHLEGNLQVRWSRLLPYINIPNTKLQEQIEKLVNNETNASFKNINIVEEELDFLGNIKLILSGYEMNKNGHQITFEAL